MQTHESGAPTSPAAAVDPARAAIGSDDLAGDDRPPELVSSARIPTTYGDFTAHVYRDRDGTDHLAMVHGDLNTGEPVLVRLHSECLTGDILGSLRCDCGTQLQTALEAIAMEGAGVLVYLRGHEGRGIGIGHKIAAYALQDEGRDTVDANLDLGLPVDGREYTIGAQILAQLGVTKMRLMTNNPAKVGSLNGHGLQVIERVGLPSRPNAENVAYLRTKQMRMGHLIEGLDETAPD